MPHRGENKRNSTLRCTKTGGIQPKLNVACFVQSCLTDADFVIFSNYCLIGTRPKGAAFLMRGGWTYSGRDSVDRQQFVPAQQAVPIAEDQLADDDAEHRRSEDIAREVDVHGLTSLTSTSRCWRQLERH